MKTAAGNNETKKKRVPGRPKKIVSRSDLLMIRLTPTEKQLIAQRAKNAGLKPSEWFRRAAKSARVFPRFTPEESGWFRILSGMANNLNQLTHLAHVAGLPTLALKCQAMIRQIEEVLVKIRDHDG
ncbi:MAG: MobC family plasmid mobilization relaxosome protein [Pedobacter sp.]|nr:MAG: MobC family plasmid mobilization relaxosome protein [Pedobacter sp.]